MSDWEDSQDLTVAYLAGFHRRDDEVRKLEAELDQVLARLASAYVVADEWLSVQYGIAPCVNDLTPTDAQEALDEVLAKAREDAIKEMSESFRAQIESMRQNVGDWSISEVPEAINDTLDDILTLINDG